MRKIKKDLRRLFFSVCDREMVPGICKGGSNFYMHMPSEETGEIAYFKTVVIIRNTNVSNR
jgi:hypothetical protein